MKRFCVVCVVTLLAGCSDKPEGFVHVGENERGQAVYAQLVQQQGSISSVEFKPGFDDAMTSTIDLDCNQQKIVQSIYPMSDIDRRNVLMACTWFGD